MSKQCQFGIIHVTVLCLPDFLCILHSKKILNTEHTENTENAETFYFMFHANKFLAILACVNIYDNVLF
jgi:hypothetical protein